jgi:hypothetical protein
MPDAASGPRVKLGPCVDAGRRKERGAADVYAPWSDPNKGVASRSITAVAC